MLKSGRSKLVLWIKFRVTFCSHVVCISCAYRINWKAFYALAEIVYVDKSLILDECERFESSLLELVLKKNAA